MSVDDKLYASPWGLNTLAKESMAATCKALQTNSGIQEGIKRKQTKATT